MIEIQHLCKRFGASKVVDDLTFQVDRGEVLGFLGPNGAGKSTTMKMVTGFLTPTSGTVCIGGQSITEKPLQSRRQIGYLPEGAPLYADMTPAALLDFVAGIRGLRGETKRQRIADVVSRIQLGDVLNQRIDTLSKGFKRRVGLAQAILHDPQVLILDEPTDGLDPNQKQEVRSLIQEMASDKAIVISTHILEEVEAVCSRALIIANGKLVADGTPQELEARSRYHNAVSLQLSAEQAPLAAARLPQLDWIDSCQTLDNRTLLIFPEGGQSVIRAVAQLATTEGWQVEQIYQQGGKLDDVFRDLTDTAGARS
ncbi:MAG: ABC transporter ATP-binding protein [Gammaproteobacteria bacterium]|nr:ABC transporter ATP-binding protein [Gammaproteobacteria bacterium]